MLYTWSKSTVIKIRNYIDWVINNKIKDQQLSLHSEFWILLDEVNLLIVVGKRCVWWNTRFEVEVFPPKEKVLTESRFAILAIEKQKCNVWNLEWI